MQPNESERPGQECASNQYRGATQSRPDQTVREQVARGDASKPERPDQTRLAETSPCARAWARGEREQARPCSSKPDANASRPGGQGERALATASDRPERVSASASNHERASASASERPERVNRKFPMSFRARAPSRAHTPPAAPTPTRRAHSHPPRPLSYTPQRPQGDQGAGRRSELGQGQQSDEERQLKQKSVCIADIARRGPGVPTRLWSGSGSGSGWVLSGSGPGPAPARPWVAV